MVNLPEVKQAATTRMQRWANAPSSERKTVAAAKETQANGDKDARRVGMFSKQTARNAMDKKKVFS